MARLRGPYLRRQGRRGLIYYTGPFLAPPYGEAFAGDVTFTSDVEENEFSGEIRFTNLRPAPVFPGE